MTMESALAQLEQAQLVRPLAAALAAELGVGYQFKHVLTQEAAYQSLPRRQRQQIHRRVARCYEQLFAQRVEEHAAVLAYHYGEAGDDDKALTYSLMAGDAALRVYATTEAGLHYDKAREIVLRSTPAAATADQVRRLYGQRGRALELDSYFVQAMDNYQEMERLAAEREDRALQLAAILAQTKLRSIINPLYDPAAGQALADQALYLAEALDDRRSQAEIYWCLMNQARFDPGRMEEAVAYGERALSIARALDAREQAAFIMNDIADVYMDVGRIDDSRQVLSQAQRLWREQGNQPMLADSLTNAGVILILAGEFEAGLATTDDALAISRRIQNIWGQAYSQGVRAMALWNLGRYGEALTDYVAGAALADQAGFLFGQIQPRMQQVMVYYELGAPELGLSLARLTATMAADRMLQYLPTVLGMLGLLCRVCGHEEEGTGYLRRAAPPDLGQGTFVFHFASLVHLEIARSEGRYEAVLAQSEAHLALLRRLELLALEADVLRQQAEALRSLGRLSEARGLLEAAVALAARLNQRRILWQTLPALAALTDDPIRAAALRAQADEVIRFVWDALPAELRPGFDQRVGKRIDNP